MTTQSEADARRQEANARRQEDPVHAAQLKTLQTAYNPDALHRTLDWIGNLFGSGHSYAPSGGSRVVDWITRQFSDPYSIGGSKNPMNYGSRRDPWGDQTGPAAEAWYRNVANSPTPFGNVQYGPPAPTPKPVTKISSGPNLAEIVRSSMGGPSEPYRPLTPLPGYNFQPQTSENYDVPGDMPPPPPIDLPMGGPSEPYHPLTPISIPGQTGPIPAGQPGAGGLPMPGQPLPGQPQADPRRRRPTLTGLGNSLGAILGITDPVPGSGLDKYIQWRNSPFGTGQPTGRARGGPMGYMRGGYPEVYGAGMPVRHTFDSGGQSYVNQGSSSGRSDDVNAKLSPKEYVVDAETMAMLGDGNPDHGAEKMDEMRANVRRHKGQALAKGKFSPKAKSAQEYLVGDPISAGLRRRGRDKG